MQAFRALSGPVIIEREKSAPSVDLSSLMPIEVEVVAELASFQLTVAQLENMAVDDVLEVGNIRTARIKVNGKPTFEGVAGEVDGHRSVQIQRRL